MSKATERAKERYWLEPNNIETQEKYAAYVEGYQQAEKDFELTWQDILEIETLLNLVRSSGLYKNGYKEVLKRFKDLKHVK